MIVALVGNRGSGKTLSMAKTVKEMLDKGRTIYTNFNINKNAIPKKQHKQLHLLTKEFFADYSKFKLYNCCLFLDEAYIYLDARLSASKKNRVWSYFINQTRKRDVDLYYSTQFFRQIEVRLRLNTEFFIFPTIVNAEDTKLVVNKIYSYTNTLKLIGVEKFVGNDYYNVYDTDEIIDFDGQ